MRTRVGSTGAGSGVGPDNTEISSTSDGSSSRATGAKRGSSRAAGKGGLVAPRGAPHPPPPAPDPASGRDGPEAAANRPTLGGGDDRPAPQPRPGHARNRRQRSPRQEGLERRPGQSEQRRPIG